MKTLWADDIAAMHEKFKVNSTVANLTPAQLKDYLKFRLDMVQEEVSESRKAFDEGDAEGIVDGLIDCIVFAIGTLDAFNVNSYEAWNKVHAANMQKEPGIKLERPNPYGFPDLIKPEGWTAPSHEGNHGLITKIFER